MSFVLSYWFFFFLLFQLRSSLMLNYIILSWFNFLSPFRSSLWILRFQPTTFLLVSRVFSPAPFFVVWSLFTLCGVLIFGNFNSSIYDLQIHFLVSTLAKCLVFSKYFQGSACPSSHYVPFILWSPRFSFVVLVPLALSLLSIHLLKSPHLFILSTVKHHLHLFA